MKCARDSLYSPYKVIIYILVSNCTYCKSKGSKVAVGVSFMFVGQKHGAAWGWKS